MARTKKRKAWEAWLVVGLSLAAVTGCSNVGFSVVGGRLDASGNVDAIEEMGSQEVGTDAMAKPDVAPDLVVPDTMDVAMDTPMDMGPPRCMSNADCAGNPAGSTCNPATGMCQPPCTSNANCMGNPSGSICDMATGLCTMRCSRHSDCIGQGGGDICNPMTNMCTNRCTGNADCMGHPSGSLCNPMTGACVMPCRSNVDCTGNPAGAICNPMTGLCSNTCRSHADCAGMMGTICNPMTNMCTNRCTSNADCMGHPDGAVCNTTTGACVQCVATADTCPPDQHCDPMSNACVSGCRADEGCAMIMATPRCNTMTHTCEQCVTDTHCPTGQRCAGGMCVVGCTSDSRCAMGERCCAGACVNPQSNSDHCGTCGNQCMTANGDPVCSEGRCAIARCTAPFGNCDGMVDNGCETNTNTSVMHCGRCGNACPSRANATVSCDTGTCSFTCNPGFADCNGSADDGCETDLNASTGNCGACGRACSVANGTAVCSMGSCAVGSCNAGFADCDMNPANGCEVNTNTTLAHCGMCGRACSAPANGTAACTMGTCGIGTCNAGFADCDMNPANGCESNLNTTPTACGACGRVCSIANGTAGCAGGACTVASCNPGFADCDGSPINGCEINLNTSAGHCGACGRACSVANGTAVCSMGSCAVGSCNPSFADCDTNPANGCEVDTRSDVNHCSGCGMRCALPGGTNVCVGGACMVSMCAAGLGNCDGIAANGCETNLNTTLAHCGACGNACRTPANGTPSCTGGTCGIASCNPGFANCDMNVTNGCEVDIRSDVNHCGACNMRCPSRPNTVASCTAGSCSYTCAAGFADCDGNPANGCETNIQTDTANCGRCRNVCTPATGGGASCTGGVCGQTCPAGQTNCSGVCRATASDVNNCGACGRVCSFANASATCTSGTCTLGACNTGFGNCDGNAANGCETDLRSTVAHCGACGRVCTAPTGGSAACLSGTCSATCPSGQTNCSGVCRNLLTDNGNCGACGRPCSTTQTCSNGVCVGSGQLRFTMTWSLAGDMDLHVVPPCGTEIYYGRRTACGGTLDVDNTTGTGPENIYWTSGAASGPYRICAVPYSIRGTTSFTIQVVRGSSPVATYTGSRSSSTGNRVCTTSDPTYVATYTY